MDILSSGASLAGDLLARTASTARVQHMVQLSLTPAFLLAAVGAFLNVMNQRLIWIVDRVHLLEKRDDADIHDGEVEELPVLRRRRRYAHWAVNLSTGAGLLICIVVSTTFVSAFVRPPLGTFVALLWIAVMVLVFGALLSFLFETQLATKSSRDTRLLSRKLVERKNDADPS